MSFHFSPLTNFTILLLMEYLRIPISRELLDTGFHGSQQGMYIRICRAAICLVYSSRSVAGHSPLGSLPGIFYALMRKIYVQLFLVFYSLYTDNSILCCLFCIFLFSSWKFFHVNTQKTPFFFSCDYIVLYFYGYIVLFSFQWKNLQSFLIFCYCK